MRAISEPQFTGGCSPTPESVSIPKLERSESVTGAEEPERFVPVTSSLPGSS